MVLYPPKMVLLQGQVHRPSEHAGSGRVREHLSLGGVASAARASTRISVGVCSDSCSCSCSSIDTRIVVRHMVRHDALQDGRIGNPRAVLARWWDGLFLPQREHMPPSGPWCLGSLRVLLRHHVLCDVLLRHVLGARMSVLVVVGG